MKASQPCDLCGCTEINLYDGFYFCTECGTQDTNIQETIIEVTSRGGASFAVGKKKKLVKIVEEQSQMPDDWYKWHAFNFVLKGTADELIEHGVNPSFKTKLLWVWTKYLKLYLNNNDIGLKKNDEINDQDDDKLDAEKSEVESEVDSDEDKPREDIWMVWEKKRAHIVRKFNFMLLMSLIYVALNIDKSDLQLTQLVKLFKEGMLSVPFTIEKLVPPELKPEKLRPHIRKGWTQFKTYKIRVISMMLFKTLDLGNPVVPDLRQILDNLLKELCLPKDLKPLVLSLMEFKSCGFLNVDSKDAIIVRVPAYELHVMTYILWALKLCFGLDCDYDVKLSDAVEAINEKENRPKSHFYNDQSEPTNRLFSIREWITFYQFRQIMLRHYCFRYANKCSWDTDDYVALEHHMDVLEDMKKDLKDEMAYDILQRMRGGEVESNIIPKNAFIPTLTPFHTYTQVIAEHLQDTELKLMLTEDFSQYSLNYAIKKRHLVNPNSNEQQNLIKGISNENKVVTNCYASYTNLTKYPKRMVYIRNCENHNWLTTLRPTLDHVEDMNDESGEDSSLISNHTVDDTVKSPERDLSKIDEESIEESIPEIVTKTEPNDQKFHDTVSDYSLSNSTLSSSIQFVDDTKILASDKLDNDEKEKLRKFNESIAHSYQIREETDGLNIFDDDFEEKVKDELPDDDIDHRMDYENTENVHFDNFDDVPLNNQTNDNDNDSFRTSLDSVNFNEATFDRAKTIKEIILFTCQKHKLPIPYEYKPKKVYKKQMGLFSETRDSYVKHEPRKRSSKLEAQNKFAWKSLIGDYYAALQDDAINAITQKVKEAIKNAEMQQHNETNAAPIDIPDLNMEIDAASNHSEENHNGSEAMDTCSRIQFDDDEDNLFSDYSDGETHAKELLPEINPNFDENVYEASQLYLKAAVPTKAAEMELDPKLTSIVDRKIQQDIKDPSLLTWTEEKTVPEYDSEEDLPLSLVKEQMMFTEKLAFQKRNRKNMTRFLDRPVENFNYWFRFYHEQQVHIKSFTKEVCDRLPESFAFVLRECAHIVDMSPSDLYKNLASYEMSSIEMCKIKIKKRKNTFLVLE